MAGVALLVVGGAAGYLFLRSAAPESAATPRGDEWLPANRVGETVHAQPDARGSLEARPAQGPSTPAMPSGEHDAASGADSRGFEPLVSRALASLNPREAFEAVLILERCRVNERAMESLQRVRARISDPKGALTVQLDRLQGIERACQAIPHDAMARAPALAQAAMMGGVVGGAAMYLQQVGFHVGPPTAAAILEGLRRDAGHGNQEAILVLAAGGHLLGASAFDRRVHAIVADGLGWSRQRADMQHALNAPTGSPVEDGMEARAQQAARVMMDRIQQASRAPAHLETDKSR